MNTTVSITDEQMAKIKAISEHTGVSADDLVRQSIDKLTDDNGTRIGD